MAMGSFAPAVLLRRSDIITTEDENGASLEDLASRSLDRLRPLDGWYTRCSGNTAEEE